MDDLDLVTTAEAAKILHKPAGTLRYWRVRGVGPKYIKMRKTVLYSRAALVDFVASCTINPTTQAAAFAEADRVNL